MEDLRGTDDAGRTAEPLDPENLRTLLHHAGAFVEVAAAAGPGRSARAERAGTERWSVAVGGTGEEVLVALLPNTDAAFDVLRSWVADDGWWREAFTWSVRRSGPPADDR